LKAILSEQKRESEHKKMDTEQEDQKIDDKKDKGIRRRSVSLFVTVFELSTEQQLFVTLS
jgi:hypothetical protein